MQIVIEIDDQGNLGAWWSARAGELLQEICGEKIEPTQKFILAPDPYIRENGLCG